jgi:hypothetical protein
MLLRRCVFAFVVVLSALLAGACSVNQGGEITFDSPTSPSTSTPAQTADPSKGDFQVISSLPSFSNGEVFTLGKYWSVVLRNWCAEGLIQGVAFVRDDGAMYQSDNAIYCKGGSGPNTMTFSEEKIDGVVYDQLAKFARGKSLRVEFATAPGKPGDSSNWANGNLTIRPGLGVTVTIQ